MATKALGIQGGEAYMGTNGRCEVRSKKQVRNIDDRREIGMVGRSLQDDKERGKEKRSDTRRKGTRIGDAQQGQQKNRQILYREGNRGDEGGTRGEDVGMGKNDSGANVDIDTLGSGGG